MRESAELTKSEVAGMDGYNVEEVSFRLGVAETLIRSICSAGIFIATKSPPPVGAVHCVASPKTHQEH
jgi:hypothetical protein